MSRLDDKSPEFQALLADACREDAPPERLQELERMAVDPDSMRVLVDYLLLDAELRRMARGQSNADKCLAGLGIEASDETVPFPKPRPAEPLFPRIAPDLLAPRPGSFGGGLQGTAGYLSEHHVVFGYLVATACFVVAALVGSVLHVSHDHQRLADNSRGSTTTGRLIPQRPDPIFVARVTGMKDCRWSDPATETYAGAYVLLGRKYALSSGLMEITYRSGAKVILEGPCRYEVESDRGGFLALGKLTARVEKRSEVRGRRSEVRGQRSEDRGLAASAASMMPQTSNLPSPIGRGAGGEGNGNQKQSALTLTLSQRERGPDSRPKPQVPSPKPQDPSPKPQDLSPKSEISKSPNLQSSKFTVRTPTALVTDLGTEFGVEVKDNGDTASYVFQGRVVVQSLAAASTRREPSPENPKSEIPNQQILLAAGQSARVEKDAATGAARIATDEKAAGAPQFVRRMYEPPKLLDLLDIVAGGNGLSNRRERGIDPATGAYDPQFVWAMRGGDRQYHPVAWSKFIDGVFVPDGREGAMPIDSAGHVFASFPVTSGEGYGSIWSRAAEVDPEWKTQKKGPWVHIMGPHDRFMPQRRGLLGLSPNAGVTFDLEAMRRTHRGVAPARFVSVAGMVDNRQRVPTADSLADLWIFVDGQLKLKREQLRPEHGTLNVNIAIGPNDRFLTLVSTDGGNGYENDYVVFGDPVLEMRTMGENE